jgi:hypothetical protein
MSVELGAGAVDADADDDDDDDDEEEEDEEASSSSSSSESSLSAPALRSAFVISDSSQPYRTTSFRLLWQTEQMKEIT